MWIKRRSSYEPHSTFRALFESYVLLFIDSRSMGLQRLALLHHFQTPVLVFHTYLLMYVASIVFSFAHMNTMLVRWQFIAFACVWLYECVQPRIEWANVSSVYVLGDVIGVRLYIRAHYTFIPNSMNGWAGKIVRCESCSLCLLVVSCHNLTFTKPYDSNIYSDIHTNITNATEMSCWFGEHAFVWDKHAYTKFCL